MPKKLVVITGASHGIGKALAQKFVGEKYPCLLISRNIKPFAEFEGHEVLYDQIDVTNYSDLKAGIKKAEKKYGAVECLINNAGMLDIGAFRDMPIEKCSYELDILVKGVINGIHSVLANMSQRRSGTIINISSIADRKPSPDAVIYHASKHAVRSIAESLQMAEAKDHVRIMNIAPGLIKTNIHRTMGVSFDEYCRILGNPTFIQPEELADIIFFCWKLPNHICIRDLVVMPTDCAY